MIESPTAFAWTCLGMGDYAPPEPVAKRGKPAPSRFGAHPLCWLCGGPTNGVGWPRELAIPDTFTNHNQARCLTSDSVCQPCAAMASKQVWEAYVAAHPEKGLKTGHAMSWRCYSHVFSPSIPDGHESPQRGRWRELLLEPPRPPFLFCVAESGQKHLIFRSRVAHDRDRFPVQCEEDRLFVDRAEFARCLEAFERLYLQGFSKDQILSADYNHAQILKAGLGVWRAAEEAFAPWRRREPDLVRLAHFCAQLPAEEKAARTARAASQAAAAKPAPKPRAPKPTKAKPAVPQPEPVAAELDDQRRLF